MTPHTPTLTTELPTTEHTPADRPPEDAHEVASTVPAIARHVFDSELDDTLLHPDDPHAMPIDRLINHLKEGRAHPWDLSPDLRRDIVIRLTRDGHSASDIASLIRITERTVRRDRAAARTASRIDPTTTLGDEWLGDFREVTMRSIERLTRLANDPNAPPSTRVWAEQTIAINYERLMTTAKRLGYIANAKHRIIETPEETEARHRKLRKSAEAQRRVYEQR